MDSKVDMYVKRAKTELESAEILKKISEDKMLKDTFTVDQDSTYYSGVISHAYYAIFYTAKAMLLTKKIETGTPNVHVQTLEAFQREFIDTGILDMNLLIIYKEMIIRAETLLEIFKEEKWKRGHFTYNMIPQANVKPAEDSIKHAIEFIKHCNTYLTK